MNREVSILVPVYNAAGFVAQTLDAALEAARDIDCEVIALNDGSSDDTAVVLQRFADRVQVLQQENAGVSATRNRLAEHASGEWLVFLDADDLLQPDTIRHRLEAAAKTAADAVYCDWQGFTQTGESLVRGAAQTRRLESYHADAALALFDGYWAPPGAWMFKRSLHARIGGFRADLPVIQDARYALDAALAGANLVHSAHLGLLYRQGLPGSLSRRDPDAFARDCLRNLRDLESCLSADGRDATRRQRAFASGYEFVARALAGRGADADAIEAMRSALRFTPTARSRWLRAASWSMRLFGDRAGLRIMRWWGQGFG